jgi:hypothetical protein
MAFLETMEESTSVALAMSHIEKKKHKRALESDRVKDSDNLNSNDFSSDEAHEKAIQVEPLDCCPLAQNRKNRLPNFGLEES